MDSELRCRIAIVYEAIMSRHNLAGHDPLKKNTMVFERRSRIASVYKVILTPCMTGRLIEVGKNVVGIMLADVGFDMARIRIH